METVNEGSGPNVRHSRYIIVESKIACPQCSLTTAVFAFALPPDYESLNPADDMADDANEAWERIEFAAVLSCVGHLTEAVMNRVAALTSHYRVDSNTPGGGEFLKNHCEHCREPIEEELLHEDLDSPFGPLGAEISEAIQVHPVREPFQAWVGGAAHDVKALDG